MNVLQYQDPQLQRAVIERATGVDYSRFEGDGVGFDYAELMASPPFSWEEVRRIQQAHKVGDTPLLELPQLTKMVRHMARPGFGAQLLLKDEAANASGSFKARRASLAVALAKRLGYPGVIAATSGNYGAAVASQAAMHGLKCIIVQEVFDSSGIGQPEILEKTRACEALGAEVVQLTVGPELFLTFLQLLDETGYFSASLYAPYSVLGVETLGFEIVEQTRALTGRDPHAVVVSHAGGGNVTGTTRGVRRAGAADTAIIGASVNLAGLHMASDHDFNRKSFTTSHTGFGVPFLAEPDRVDVPRNACRPLRYLDRYVTVEQGEVFFATELLAKFEGIERGPAGNTSLAAALVIARELPSDRTVVIQETEYTGAGKSHFAQLEFARRNGIEVRTGDSAESVPGTNIVIPRTPADMTVRDIDLPTLKKKFALARLGSGPTDADLEFMSAETGVSVEQIGQWMRGAA
ncbi:threonine dehydratase [Mycobacterium frederiksbergense]|uniref:Threonine dehydratase n=1 Tax=Mycolicibacterium frederiksbergense TaxID=117567 RepID=A0ABT6L722_9MYCO|nr:2-amino-4-oxopentanoate thiolase subunit OrtB [Mycolicibacterium frederiksbergense]MDH6197765.1 threonine dehydratase [Mycolicibacterium frederiksbergense]